MKEINRMEIVYRAAKKRRSSASVICNTKILLKIRNF